MNLWKIIKPLLAGYKTVRPVDEMPAKQSKPLWQLLPQTVEGRKELIAAQCSNANLAAMLLLMTEREKAGAIDKQSNPGHWGSVGNLELRAAQGVIGCINSVPQTMEHQQYRQMLGHELGELAAHWRNIDADEDGFGLGTVHSVGTLLAEYTG